MLDWLSLLPLLIAFGLFPLAGRLIFTLRISQSTAIRLFAALNLAFSFGLCALGGVRIARLSHARDFAAQSVSSFAVYFMLVLLQYWAMRWWSRRQDSLASVPLYLPLLYLIVLKYVPVLWSVWVANDLARMLLQFVGISYMAFRLSHCALEVKNGVVSMPTPASFLAFAFFVPTLSVGPISPFSKFASSMSNSGRPIANWRETGARLLVGLTKYLFLASLCSQLAYTGLLLDSHKHHWVDLAVAVFAYFFFLYLNFSGYCDMAIAVSASLGLEVAENFNSPLVARNLQDFWNRWHITLSAYLRDFMFSPIAKDLTRRWGPARGAHAIAATIVVVFLVIGVWHGVGLNFAAYGLAHGFGVATVHYYTIFLKKRLGREGYQRYENNRLILWTARAITLSFAAASVFLFANDWTQAGRIFEMLA